MVASEVGIEKWVRRRGVVITGDEPHYLVTARSLSHFRFQLKSVYEQYLQTHGFVRPRVGLSYAHAYMGPHGAVSVHGLGLSALVMPFLVVGGTPMAYGGFFAAEAAGLIYLHQRASRLTGLGLAGRAVLAVALASPAVLLAGTQLYPDLITGILLAIALVEIAATELTGELSILGAVALVVTTAPQPWIHDKNMLPAAVVVGALIVLAFRKRRLTRRALVVMVLVGGSYVLHLAYNVYYFGHLLGYPQPPLSVGLPAVKMGLALLFDRDQGLFVQVPAVILGVAGLLIVLRRLPVAVLATVATMATVLGPNAGFVGNPYGGASLAGRFEWSLVPILLAWSPPLLRRLERLHWRSALVTIGLALLDAAEIVPLARRQHVYYNVGSDLWDPSAYPSWWPGLKNGLPAATAGSGVLGAPWYGTLLEIALGSAVLTVLLLLGRPDSLRVVGTGRELIARHRTGLGGMAVAGAAGGGVLALLLTAPPGMPARSLHLTGWGLLDDPRVSTTAWRPSDLLIPVGRGTFSLSVAYELLPPEAAGFTAACGTRSTSAALTPTTAPEQPSDSVLHLRCRRGYMRIQVSAGAAPDIKALNVTVRKLSN